MNRRRRAIRRSLAVMGVVLTSSWWPGPAAAETCPSGPCSPPDVVVSDLPGPRHQDSVLNAPGDDPAVPAAAVGAGLLVFGSTLTVIVRRRRDQLAGDATGVLADRTRAVERAMAEVATGR